MGECYDVLLGQERVGKVEAARQGLYLYIDCRCRLSGEVIYRLQLTCGECHENLGVLVPEGDCFSLKTKLPVKRLGAGSLLFRVVPRHSELAGMFVPIRPEEPFSYIHRLKQAFLEKRNGELGARIP